jgi:hypothetical protein
MKYQSERLGSHSEPLIDAAAGKLYEQSLFPSPRRKQLSIDIYPRSLSDYRRFWTPAAGATSSWQAAGITSKGFKDMICECGAKAYLVKR